MEFFGETIVSAAATNQTPPSASRPVRLAAVGDLMLAAGPFGSTPLRDAEKAFCQVRPLLSQADVAFGNLECTLPGDGTTVPTEPRVVSTPEMVREVKRAGLHVVSLANNHMFDCLQEGFHRLRELLGELGVAFFGAGDNLNQAAAPAILQARGIRLAFLGAADHRSGTPFFASPGRWGVAPLDLDRLAFQIRELRGEVDHVIVSPHWGEERFLIPSPQQVDQARKLIDAGASMILGHHPHVLQGLEFHNGRPIIYSLGNFLATDVPYANGDAIRWNRTERTGCILTADLTATGVAEVHQTPTYDDGVAVTEDASGFGPRRIATVNRSVHRGVTVRRYRREYRWVKTFRPALRHLRWSELRKLRLRQVRQAVALLLGARKAR